MVFSNLIDFYCQTLAPELIQVKPTIPQIPNQTNMVQIDLFRMKSTFMGFQTLPHADAKTKN